MKPNATIRDKTTIKDLRECVGHLFFVWSQLERALRTAITEFDKDTPAKNMHGLTQTLALWKHHHLSALPHNTEHAAFIEEVFEVLSNGVDIRNRLAHGIQNYGLSGCDKKDAYITTTLNEKSETNYLTELRSLIDQLGKLSSNLSRISNFTKDPSRWDHINFYADVRNSLSKNRPT